MLKSLAKYFARTFNFMEILAMLLRTLAAAAVFALPSLAHAVGVAGDWSVDDDASALYYVSTKKGHVAESHVVEGVSGSLGADGTLVVELDMASVDSGIEVRDTRMRDMLFKVTDFPKAVFTAEIDFSEFEELEVGETMESYVDGELELVGVSTPLDFAVMVTRAGEDRVMVVSQGPIILDASDLELAGGVDELMKVAKLPSISYAVPVSLSVAFARQ